MKGKIGGEKLLSVWWFFVLVIIGGGISIAVIMNYGASVDVRQIEANVLYEKIIDCAVEQGFLVEDLSNENVFEKCGLSEKVFGENSNFYFRISFLDEQGDKLKDDISKGANFEVGCKTLENEKKPEAKYWAKCIEKTENMLYYQNTEIKKGVVQILTASNQEGE